MLVWWQGRERRLLGLLATVLQDLGREVMPLEHPTNPSVVHRDGTHPLDNPGQLAIGKGLGDCQLHEVLLDVTRQAFFDRGLTPRMAACADRSARAGHYVESGADGATAANN